MLTVNSPNKTDFRQNAPRETRKESNFKRVDDDDEDGTNCHISSAGLHTSTRSDDNREILL